jgi:hypothetical protein
VLLSQCDCWRGLELEKTLTMPCKSCHNLPVLPTTNWRQPCCASGLCVSCCTCGLSAAPSPRLTGCLEAAKAAGASEEWLRERYSSIRKTSTHGHQAFRVLCHAGPGGGRGVCNSPCLDSSCAQCLIRLYSSHLVAIMLARLSWPGCSDKG